MARLSWPCPAEEAADAPRLPFYRDATLMELQPLYTNIPNPQCDVCFELRVGFGLHMHPCAKIGYQHQPPESINPGCLQNIAKQFFLYEKGSLLETLGWQFLRSLPVDVEHGLGLHFVFFGKMNWSGRPPSPNAV